MRIILSMCLLLFTSQAIGQVTGKAGRLLKIESKSAGKVTWYIGEGLREVDMTYRDGTGKTLVIAGDAGRYIILEITTEKDAPVFIEHIVVIEGSGPTPIPDSFFFKLKTAFAADKASGKAVGIDKLGQVFRQMVSSVDNTAFKTVEGVNEVAWVTAGAFVPAGNLPATQQAVKDRVTLTGELTPDLRARLRVVYAEIATGLESLVGPNPPGPDIVPIPGEGLRVLMVYESATGIPKQVSAAAVRNYLATRAKDWRALDKDTDMQKDLKIWADAMKRPRASVPWIIISDPANGRGFEGPLPESVEKTLELLKRYAE